jgi:hypothetical protein
MSMFYRQMEINGSYIDFILMEITKKLVYMLLKIMNTKKFIMILNFFVKIRTITID